MWQRGEGRKHILLQGTVRRGQSQTMTRPSLCGDDDSRFELITLRLYIKALRLQQAALREHLLGISKKQLDMRAKSTRWGEGKREASSLQGKGQEILSLMVLAGGGSPPQFPRSPRPPGS